LTGETSTTKIYVGDKGSPDSVTGESSWSYDEGTRILTINVIHASPAEVVIDWEAAIRTSFGDAARTIISLFTIGYLIGVVRILTDDSKKRRGFFMDRIMKFTVLMVVLVAVIMIFAQILINLGL